MRISKDDRDFQVFYLQILLDGIDVTKETVEADSIEGWVRLLATTRLRDPKLKLQHVTARVEGKVVIRLDPQYQIIPRKPRKL